MAPVRKLSVLAAAALAAGGAAVPPGGCDGSSGECPAGRGAAALDSVLLQTKFDRGAGRKPEAPAAAASDASEVVITDAADEVSMASDMRQITTFFWNVHWQCSTAARGASGSCKDNAVRRFAELVRENHAEIAASVELSHGMATPVHMYHHGLNGWTQVDGPCRHGGRADSAALMFAPNWKVLKSDGGCLRHDDDTRAFAVALVQPPAPVRGCPNLCIVAIHAPHQEITTGRDMVNNVCGEAVHHCAMAMGDWNVPADKVDGLWSRLIGGEGPGFKEPNERTCCYPEDHHYGVFDHLVSNIPGAQSAGYAVMPYQILDQNPVEEHKPVVAHIAVPTDR